MSLTASAEQALRHGDPATALELLKNEVREHPADPKLRIFLFQLMAVMGEWERAMNQLAVAAELDPAALAMAQMYRDALRCESLRAEVFAGKRSPMVFGQPEEWLALLIEALLREGSGQVSSARKLREAAFQAAPASGGTIDGTVFEWIADADMRFGPVLEAIINGGYYWVPFSRLSLVNLDEPTDLRDVVWMPAHLRFSNGGESVALIPTRYPRSETQSDGAVCLARKTLWQEVSPGVFEGLGQRQLATDAGEVSIMDVRSIAIGAPPNEPGTLR
jgi:type VI secretion system protein ImpE